MGNDPIGKFAKSDVILHGDAKKNDGRRGLGTIVKRLIGAGVAVIIAITAAQVIPITDEKDSSFLLPRDSEMVYVTSSMLATYEVQAMDNARESAQFIKDAGHKVCFYVTHDMPGISYYTVEASPCSHLDDFNRSLGESPDDGEKQVAHANQLSADIKAGGPTDFIASNMKEAIKEGIFVPMSDWHARLLLGRLNSEVAVAHNIDISGHRKP